MSNEKIIWDYLRAKGLNEFGTAGLMGNLYAESGLVLTNLQSTYERSLGMSDDAYTKAVDNGTYTNFVNDKAGYGLAQWTYWSRKQNLLNFAKSRKVSIGNLNMQLDFLWSELSSYGLVAALTNATSVLAASNVILLQFEKPKDQSADVQRKRADFGQAYYDKYATKSAQAAETKGVVNMSAVDRLIATARAEVGYLEKATNANLDDKTANAGSNNWTKYARDLDNLGNIYNGKKNGYAWCDMFVDWCFIKTFGVELAMKLLCQAYNGAGAGCTYSAQYYKNKGQFYKSSPKPGDQIFFTNDGGASSSHTGIVVAVDSSRVYTVEGNTSSAVGVVANGGCVREKSYSLFYGNIYGYGRPDWSLAGCSVSDNGTQDKAVNYQGKVKASDGLNCRTEPVSGSVITTYPNGTVLSITKERNGWGYTGLGWVSLTYVDKINQATKEDDDMLSYEDWKKYMDQYRKEHQDNDRSGWSKEASEFCIANGLFNGAGKDAKGEPNYMYEDFLTREQAMQLLFNFAKWLGKA